MRRALLLTTSLLILLAPAVAGAKSDPGRSLGPATTDVRRDAAADLVSARLEQQGHTLTVWLGFAAAPKPALFRAADGGRICMWITTSGPARRLCATTVDGAWQLSTEAGEVLRVGKRRLGLRFPDDTLKLRPGSFRWRVTTTVAGCTPAEGTPPCVDRLPEAPKNIKSRVYVAKLTGCRATGDPQVSNGDRGLPRIALTFDDGPWAYTSAVLDLLKANGAHGTFFQLGMQIRGKDADVTRRVLAEGHELANHSWNHANLGRAGDAATTQMRQTNAAIRKATGFTPCLFRPPYGATSRDLVSRTRALDMTSVLWDVDTDDYQRLGVDAIRGHLVNEPRSGSIVLMHDGGGDRSQTVAALADALPTLQKRYELVTVSELLGYTQMFKLVR